MLSREALSRDLRGRSNEFYEDTLRLVKGALRVKRWVRRGSSEPEHYARVRQGILNAITVESVVRDLQAMQAPDGRKDQVSR